MKKITLLLSVVVLVAVFAVLYTSCKKPVHALQPTPNNVRLMSYTATTHLLSETLADTTSDNYTFFYDGNNRVIKILYSTSDTAKIRLLQYNSSVNITFSYSNDTCIKTTAALGGSPVIEIDTFIINSSTGLIATTFTPGMICNYQYYGKLLAIESDEYYNNYHGVTSVSDTREYTSDNGNFLASSFNGILNVTFPTTMHYTPYAMRDYWMNITGLNTTAPNLIDVHHTPQIPGTIHTGLTKNTDQLDYTISGTPLLIFATDTARDTCYVDFPGNIWPSQSYTFYNNLANRIGDYLQLGSFTMWGNNLYQNADLVHTIVNSGYTTNVTYNINSYSEITQMTAVIVDSLANTRNVTYNLQYETY